MVADNKKLKQKSPAEFFADNKNIAGFDNPGKSLYTTIRELVENSLDAAESAGQLPEIELTIEEISQKKLNTIQGMDTLGRRDAALYQDHETEAQRKKREEKEGKDLDRKIKAARSKAAADAKKKNADIPEAEERAEEEARKKHAADTVGRDRGVMFYKVTCRDNGMGMSHNDIPNMLGKVLSGTKYGVKQTRGKFGLGAKMTLIWSKMSTGLPIEVWSARSNSATISYYKLDIDINKNEPNIHKQELQPNKDKWRGAHLAVTIEGQWNAYRHKIINYLRQMAVITPYATFKFKFEADDPKHSLNVHFSRRTDSMPSLPQETKYHPSAVNIELIKTLLANTKAKKLTQFLMKEFVSIKKDKAARLVAELGKDFDPDMPPEEVSDKQVVRIHQLFKEVKFDAPTGDCLSPAGEYNLRLGVIKELQPDMVATFQGAPGVFEGHPFVVECAVSIGGKDVKPGINVFRFANRIPLLWEGGGDVATRTANKRINWSSYKIGSSKDNTDKVGVFVSIVSTKIPFKGTSKEYVGDDIPQMVAAVKHAIQNCAVQLKSKISRVQAAQERQQRKKNLTKYIPDVCRAIYAVLEDMGDAQGTKRGREDPAVDVVSKVARKEVNEAHLAEKLREHVEQVDSELSLAYQTAAGMKESGTEGLYLVPTSAIHQLGPELHGPCCVVKLLE